MSKSAFLANGGAMPVDAPNVYFLIAAHALALGELERLCPLVDEAAAKLEGRTVTLEDQDANDLADEAEQSALLALVHYRPASQVEQAIKAQYLSAHAGSNWVDGEKLYPALLASLVSPEVCGRLAK